MKTKKPIFQQANNEKRFTERFVSNKRYEKSTSKSPHVDNNSKRALSNRHSRPQNTQNTASHTHIINTTMEKPNGTGQVQVVLKRSSLVAKTEKKTGPLSPRAPEKIKKNRAEEMKVYGENACLSLFAQRPESIVRVWTTVEMAHKVGDLFSYLASNKKVYHVVDNSELALVSGTEHHGGICMLVKKRRPFTLHGYLDIPQQKNCLLVLNGVRNPHNIGGIIRTCVCYGISAVVIDDVELLHSAVAMRVAEGGMEYIHPLEIDRTETALVKLRQAGYQIVHLSSNKHAKTIKQLQLDDKVAFVLSEADTESLADKADELINLSLVNPLKHGLNVSVATGILLAKWTEVKLC
ncbi:TrmH family RNA methyltransferase [Histophilus somni]|uniref:TrmH family RNA methyltransferase n=1 Tax=Histophilus somni TaxID=731 RepID=UPI000045D63F|nr:TrmH family RNA methyltransferase [Histophilus somni]ACA31485.1 tRNA/rRNA methyltransferase (SpoU) [Histophilus somni 2336]QQF85836.1 rRNA methyltransferase [Histophilus somni]QQJ90353.1 rRNA methyltransferase [Histophilus somni]